MKNIQFPLVALVQNCVTRPCPLARTVDADTGRLDRYGLTVGNS